MLAVQTSELVICNLHELGSFTLIALCLLKGSLYKACFQSILGLIKAVKRKTVKGKTLVDNTLVDNTRIF